MNSERMRAFKDRLTEIFKASPTIWKDMATVAAIYLRPSGDEPNGVLYGLRQADCNTMKVGEATHMELLRRSIFAVNAENGMCFKDRTGMLRPYQSIFEPQVVVCDCGSAKTNQPGHSHWCKTQEGLQNV